jgi:hypothetical protein
MRKVLISFFILCCGCATSEASEKKPPMAERDGRDAAAASQLRAVLESLPRCDGTARIGVVSIKATQCTKMYCTTGCCNQCGWNATFETKTGESVPLSVAQVRDTLRVSEGALECEIAAWGRVLAKAPMALEGSACVVR